MKKESYFCCTMVAGPGKICYDSGIAFSDEETSAGVVLDAIKKNVAKSRDCNIDDIIVLAFNRV